MSRYFRALILGTTASLCFGLATSAAPTRAGEKIRVSEEIFVTDKARRGSVSAPSLEAAKTAIDRVPGAVEFIPAERFEGRYAINFEDMLAGVPGVFARKRFGEEVRLSIRGSGISRSFHMRGIKLLLDGVPLTAADGTSDFQEIDPTTIRYLEVFKGGNGLRYGAASLGGAVNIVTPTGHTSPSRANFRLEGGSFNTVRAHGSFAHAGDTSDGYIAATFSQSDGFRDHNSAINGRVSGNFGVKLSEASETRFYLAYNNANLDVPGTLSLADALDRPKTVAPINKLNDYSRDVEAVRLTNRTVWTGDNLRLEAGAYGSWKSLYHPIFQVLDQTSWEGGVFAKADHDGTVFGLAHALTLGATIGWGSTDAKRFVNLGGKRGALTADADQKARNIEVYGESRLTVAPALDAILGLQFVHATRDYADRLAPALSADASFSGASPKFGLLWSPSEKAQVFANISRSFEPPTFSELVQAPYAGFVPLAPQRAWTAEAGTRGASGRWSWDITGFYSWVRGELLQYSVDPTVPASTFNADRTVHRGLEIGLGVTLGEGLAAAGDRLSLHQSYTFSDFRFVGDAQYGDNQIAGLPRHLLYTEVTYRHPAGFTVSPSLDWVPVTTFADYANSLSAPKYAVFNLAVRWQGVESGWGAFVDGRNLTDKRYISNIGTITDARLPVDKAVFYPGDGRAVFVGLTKSF